MFDKRISTQFCPIPRDLYTWSTDFPGSQASIIYKWFDDFNKFNFKSWLAN